MKISNFVLPLDYTHPYWKDNFGFLKGYIMQSLGYPLVRVELTESMLAQSIHDALAIYFKYSPDVTWTGFEVLDLDADGQATLPTHIVSSLIKDVVFPQNSNAFGFVNPIDEGLYATLPMASFIKINGGTLELGHYYQARQQLEDANKITGRSKSWEHINGKLQVFPTRLTGETRQIGVLYGSIPDPIDLESDDFVRAYAVASAKIILGTIRRKFSGFAAAGGNGTADGSDLISEGKTDQETLKTSAKAGRPAIPILQE
jgi:hypothetical protein